MPEVQDLAALCEAVLAVAGEPVSLNALVALAGEGTGRDGVGEALSLLQERYSHESSGLVLEEVAGGWRLATRPDLDGVIRAFLGARSRTRLSQAALETLAIVAYRQPITLAEINFLRGVNSAGVVRTLLDRKLVRVAGRKQVVGTPLLYRTTRDFLIHFGLNDLAGLPSPEEAAEVAGGGSIGS